MFSNPNHIQELIRQSPCNHAGDMTLNAFNQLLREPGRQSESQGKVPELQAIDTLPIAVSGFLRHAELSTTLHSVRVAMMSRVGAEVMQIGSWQRNSIELSGLAHDLGKQIPEVNHIINNGRVLTATEREIVNKHAQYGFELLYDSHPYGETGLKNRLGDFLGNVALDVLFSHSHATNVEQRGLSKEYLDELVEKSIVSEHDADHHKASVSAQLVAVADVVDALLSSGPERSYRLERQMSENRPMEIDPKILPSVVAEIIDVPAIDLTKVVSTLVGQYDVVSRAAQRYTQSIR